MDNDNGEIDKECNGTSFVLLLCRQRQINGRQLSSLLSDRNRYGTDTGSTSTFTYIPNDRGPFKDPPNRNKPIA